MFNDKIFGNLKNNYGYGVNDDDYTDESISSDNLFGGARPKKPSAMNKYQVGYNGRINLNTKSNYTNLMQNKPNSPYDRGNYSLGTQNSMNNYSNIDINIDKFKKPSNFSNQNEKKQNLKKKKKDFMDELDNELLKEQKKDEDMLNMTYSSNYNDVNNDKHSIDDHLFKDQEDISLGDDFRIEGKTVKTNSEYKFDDDEEMSYNVGGNKNNYNDRSENKSSISEKFNKENYNNTSSEYIPKSNYEKSRNTFKTKSVNDKTINYDDEEDNDNDKDKDKEIKTESNIEYNKHIEHDETYKYNDEHNNYEEQYESSVKLTEQSDSTISFNKDKLSKSSISIKQSEKKIESKTTEDNINKTKDNNNNNIYNAAKMEEYLKKSQAITNRTKSEDDYGGFDDVKESQNSQIEDKSLLDQFKSNRLETEENYNDFEDLNSSNNNNNSKKLTLSNSDVIRKLAMSQSSSNINVMKDISPIKQLNQNKNENKYKEKEKEIYLDYQERKEQIEKQNTTKQEFNKLKENTSNVDIVNIENNPNLLNLINSVVQKYTDNILSQNLINNTKSDPTNITKANEEIRQKKFEISENLNFSFKKLETPKKFINLLIYKNEDMFIYNKLPTSKELKTMKLEQALNEERKRKDFLQIDNERMAEELEELKKSLKNLKSLESENFELKKLKLENESNYESLQKDYQNLKYDYEEKVKMMEERVVLRESKMESRKINEIKRNFEIDIENLKNELNEKIKEIEYFSQKADLLEKENNKLSNNKLSNIEINQKIQELQNENYILYEKNCKLVDKIEKLEKEKNLIEQQQIEDEFKQKNLGSTATFKDYEQKNELKFVEKIEFSREKDFFNQLLEERELSIQDNICRAYLKEIEKLSNEIKELKDINYRNNKVNAQKPLIQEKSEETLKMFIQYLENNQITAEKIENEYNIINKSKDGLMNLEEFFEIFTNLNISYQKYDLIHIFNNFNKFSKNSIRFTDFISALRSRTPSNFFIQNDPSFIQNLEREIIRLETENKQLIQILDENKNEQESFIKIFENLKNNYENLEKAHHELKNNYHKVKEENLALTSQSLNLNRNQINFEQIQQKSEELKKFKEKNKKLENENLKNLNEFNFKLKEYEEKFLIIERELKNSSENEIKTISKEFSEKIESLKEENSKMKESLFTIKHEKENLEIKVSKMKILTNKIKEEHQKISKENEKFRKIKNFEEIINLENKIEELERRNKERDEHYKMLCINANSYQVKKELDTLQKKHDEEKTNLINIINLKNKEMIAMKQEFEEILREIENIRSNKKLRS